MPSSRALFLEVSHADTRQCDSVSRAPGETKGRTDPYRRLISRRVQTRSSERFDAISFVISSHNFARLVYLAAGGGAAMLLERKRA